MVTSSQQCVVVFFFLAVNLNYSIIFQELKLFSHHTQSSQISLETGGTDPSHFVYTSFRGKLFFRDFCLERNITVARKKVKTRDLMLPIIAHITAVNAPLVILHIHFQFHSFFFLLSLSK